ncbi:MAG: VWA domain-containing protein, partial [Pseudomonadota bacterium]
RLADDVFVRPEADTEAFSNQPPSSLKITTEDPVATFSADIDTASYGVVRSSLKRGQMPPQSAVRIEEMINYFPYDYPAPDGPHPFQPTVTVAPTPWNPDTQLVHIAVQGETPATDDRPPLNLVFLIDTSGSMQDPAKLPLLKQSFAMMLSELRPEDQVAIVTYAGSAGQVLEPTAAADRDTILAALDRLEAGGSTAGQAGLQQAYSVADGMAEDGEVTRVLLATDGDFNVGLSDPEALKDFIADKRDRGAYLSVLGFGRGNLDDATMQALAQNGNGTAAYIDTLSEARKVLVDQLTGALFPIADDVKFQVEFNPAQIAEYRLIGYETRTLNREDFNNDQVDAGDIGAGLTVTAIFEVTPVGSDAVLTSALRYQPTEVESTSEELGYLKIRYKAPGEDTSILIETPILPNESTLDGEAGFAAAIAGFGSLLRGVDYLGDWSYADTIALAQANKGEDPFGYRAEAITLMRLAETMDR